MPGVIATNSGMTASGAGDSAFAPSMSGMLKARKGDATSSTTLKLQGGPMSAAEIARFETERYYQDAVSVRRWDDRGKIAGLKTPSLADYATLIDGLASANGAGAGPLPPL